MDTVKRKWHILSGSWLKLIAIISMLIDHMFKSVFLNRGGMLYTPFVSVGGLSVSFAAIASLVGRLAFPLYCFLLTEGFVHTRNRKRYGINLLLFALISELPWNFFHTGGLLYERQNVFFTLFLGYCALCVLEHIERHPIHSAAGVLGLFALSFIFKADYGYYGFAIIVAMYVLRNIAVARAVVCTGLFSASWRAGLAFIPIAMYNGERGFIKGNVGKYFFYAFYPLHLLVLGLLRFFVLN